MKISTFDLRLFQAIVDLGGISAAARHLNREKSTVSRDLAALEDRLGLRLLHRTTRTISLTEAGAILIGFARRVAEEIDLAEAALVGLDDEPRPFTRYGALCADPFRAYPSACGVSRPLARAAPVA